MFIRTQKGGILNLQSGGVITVENSWEDFGDTDNGDVCLIIPGDTACRTILFSDKKAKCELYIDFLWDQLQLAEVTFRTMTK